jgi:hypothetical protein
MPPESDIARDLLEELFESPVLYPQGTDLETVTFWRMRGRSDYDLLPHAPQTPQVTLSLPPLLDLAEGLAARPAPHFIFMTEYCCSTLLIRCLGALSGVMTVNEPHFFARLAIIRRTMDQGEILNGGEPRWEATVRLGLRLLSRTYAPSDRVLIKEWPPSNYIMGSLLAASPSSQGLFLYSDLRTYILSVLKDSRRRQITRRRLIHEFTESERQFPGFKAQKESLSDAQAAAFHWLHLVHRYVTSVRADGPGTRMRSLNCELLLTDPMRTLSAVSAHFGLNHSGDEIRRLVASPVFNTYSKPQAPVTGEYDTSTRQTELRKAEAARQAELQEGLAWADELLAAHPLPAEMPQPLLP